MTQAVALAQLGNSGVNFRNKIINGNFDIWQRGTSFTNAGYSADRWFTTADTNSGWTVSRQAFTFGQTEVPNEPTYFLRFAISASNLAGPTVQQRIEDVRTFAGKTVTATFYAKVSAGSTFTPGYFRMTQNFGSSGSADAYVVANETLTALTSSWAKYTYTFNVPSIAGKTIGAGNYVTFMFRIPDSTTTTVDFAQVQVEEGTTATAFEQRPIGTELQLCLRYYEQFGNNWWASGETTNYNVVYAGSFLVQKRAVPTCSLLYTDLTLYQFGVANRNGSGCSIISQGQMRTYGGQIKVAGWSTITTGQLYGGGGSVASGFELQPMAASAEL
jgi:hypothetical protein